MFPIPWNFPFRKKDGTLGKIEDIGESPLPEYSSSDEGKVLSVKSDGTLEWGDIPAQLPEYGIADAGKVLGVTDEGTLAWVTVSGGNNRFSNAKTRIPFENITVSAKEVTE